VVDGKLGVRAAPGPWAILWPALVALTLALLDGWLRAGQDVPVPTGAAGILALTARLVAWGLATVAVVRGLERFVWHDWMRRRTGRPAARLLAQLSATVVVAAFVGLVCVLEFRLPLAGLLTTSGLLIAIIGFALRNIISDLFTGIAFGIDGPFRLGDWIEVEGTVGQVTEINWRATTLVTREDKTVVVPNSALAVHTVVNYSAPRSEWRDQLELVLPYEVTADRAERLLRSAVAQVRELRGVGRPSEARVGALTEQGVLWRLRYWVPDYPSRSRLRHAVHRALLRNLELAGIRVPRPALDVMERPGDGADPASADRRFLRGVDLLAVLSDAELDAVEAALIPHEVPAERPVVRQGEPGASLFVVREGVLDVRVADEDGSTTHVDQLGPGSFFGELSLVTGAPRSATVVPTVDSVVLEVPRSALEPLLRARPELAARISETLEERRSNRARVLAEQRNRNGEAPVQEPPLRERIREFFGL
jgi:small-conductance mechanosensitive channel/CRP-like cAMP-binding protein